MPLRFLLGFFANPLYVISETWLLAITPAPRRARIMGLYSAIVSGGFAIGPLSLGLVGTEGWPPFMVGIVAFLVCGLIVLAVVPRTARRMPHDGEATSSAASSRWRRCCCLRFSPPPPSSRPCFPCLRSMAQRSAAPKEHIASLITCFIAGNALLQVLLGRVAEQLGSTPNHVVLCPGFTGRLPAVATGLRRSWPIWPLVSCWGGVSFGIYTISLIQLGERFTGQALIAGNAAFALVWGIGGIVGSPTTGLAMQLIGHQGLPSSLGLLSCVLVMFLMAARRQG
jgi:hypothetical protein